MKIPDNTRRGRWLQNAYFPSSLGLAPRLSRVPVDERGNVLADCRADRVQRVPSSCWGVIQQDFAFPHSSGRDSAPFPQWEASAFRPRTGSGITRDTD